jgi:radical SAM-linked protein
MQANYVQRLRLTFSKMGPARFTGHLDLSRTLERSFNRARIPIAYSQGFNRRPRMSLAAALPLGFTSGYELADIWLGKEMEPAVAQAQMMHKMAPGIVISDVTSVPLSLPSLQSTVTSACYDVYLPPAAVNQSDLPASIEKILAAKSLPQQRKRGRGKIKNYDLRPLIIDLKAEVLGNGSKRISMELCLGPGGSGRPDDVLLALLLDPFEALIHRTKITLSHLPIE